MSKNKIHPCLWFNGNAKEAAEFYCSVFKNSRITTDTEMVVEFELDGQKFMGLNGGPKFTPNPSVSFFVVFDTAGEVDEAWGKLKNGGDVLMPLDQYEWSEQYGWIQDRFGVSWQLTVRESKYEGENFIPALMFTNAQAGKAEQAMQFYTSLFDNSDISLEVKYTAEDEDVEGTIKHGRFKLNGKPFIAMDSSLTHNFGFNEGISIVVNCKNQEEIDHYWNELTRDGEESMCGWLKDKYGLSWQIIPEILGKLMTDPEKAPRVMEAFFQMRKFDINTLMKAADGK